MWVFGGGGGVVFEGGGVLIWRCGDLEIWRCGDLEMRWGRLYVQEHCNFKGDKRQDMDLDFKYTKLKKKVDAETGSILFYRDDMKGLPEQVYHGDGFIVEVKNKEVYLIDIYNAEKVLGKLLESVDTEAA